MIFFTMIRILVVDDWEGMRALLVRYFTMVGWTPLAVSDGKEALKHFQPGQFHIALIDVELGAQPNGIKLAEKIHGLDPHIKIIMTSGNTHYRRRIEDKNLGLFLEKPFALEQLENLIKNLV